MLEKPTFWSQFASALGQRKLMPPVTFPAEILDHVYFTDIVKCDDSDGSMHSHIIHNDGVLKEELGLLVQADLIITIGADAWKKMTTLVGGLSPVRSAYQHMKTEPSPSANLTAIHGVLFQSQKERKYLIPLVFPPGGNNNPLRNSYFEYFGDGLAAFPKHAERKHRQRLASPVAPADTGLGGVLLHSHR